MTDTNVRSPDEKFLDELYAQTKNETSPESIDNKILMEAKAHAEKKYSPVFKWQRFASVAAVMVFSIYIFFDVHEQRENHTESDVYSPRATLQVAPKVDYNADFRTDSEYSSGEHIAPKGFTQEPSLQESVLEETVVKEIVVEKALPVIESTVSTGAKTESVQAIKEVVKKAVKKERIPKKKASEMQAKKQIAEQNELGTGVSKAHSEYRKTPQQWIMEIRLMMAKMRTEKARELYERLLHEYPDYDVPQDIEIYMKALDKRNNK